MREEKEGEEGAREKMSPPLESSRCDSSLKNFSLITEQSFSFTIPYGGIVAVETFSNSDLFIPIFLCLLIVVVVLRAPISI